MSEATTPVVRLGTATGRGVLFATVLGSGISFLDSLVINTALPKIDQDLHLGITGLQWSVSGFLVAISAFLLLGGSLGDIYGRRRIYLVGLGVFTAASMACGLAPDTLTLIVARVVQGLGGALMVPASLAIIQAVFAPEDRGRAIGTWTGLSSIFTATGPFVGGVFVTYISWRWAFFINVPLAVLSWWTTRRWVPETKEPDSAHRPDFGGALLAALGLGGVSFWSIESSGSLYGQWPLLIGVAGIALLVAFVFYESRVRAPMMPLVLFKSHQFNWVNLCTIVFYGAFTGGVTFLGVQLQTNLGYSALEASLASLPVSAMMLLLSGRFGGWGARVGARYPMALGPAIVAGALYLMGAIQPGRDYLTYVLPVVVLWGLGLSMTVAPLTAAALAAVDERFLGVGSAVNNAASRVGTSLAVSLMPAAVGLGATTGLGGPEFGQGFRHIMYLASGLCLAAGLIALAFVSGKPRVSVDRSEEGSQAG